MPPPPTAPPAPAAPPKPEFPALQLQGIFYRPSKPSAVINGRTLGVGDQLGGVKILAIEPQAVKVEFNGETRTLQFQ